MNARIAEVYTLALGVPEMEGGFTISTPQGALAVQPGEAQSHSEIMDAVRSIMVERIEDESLDKSEAARADLSSLALVAEEMDRGFSIRTGYREFNITADEVDSHREIIDAVRSILIERIAIESPNSHSCGSSSAKSCDR